MCQGWGVSVTASRTQWANLIWTLLSLNSGKFSVSVIYYAFPLLSLIYSCESHISPHTFFLQVFCFLSPTLSYCLPGVSSGKEPTCQCRRHKRHNRCEFDPLVRRSPWRRNPLQCSCLENPKDRGAGGLQSMGSQRVRLDWNLCLYM